VSASVSPVRDAGGTIIGAAGIHRDIGERKATEQRARDLAHDAVIVRDATTSTMVAWNRGAERLYGWTAAEAIGRVIHDLLATIFPDSWEAVAAALARDGAWETARIQMRQSLALDLRVVDLAALVARVASELAHAHAIRVEGTSDPLPGLYDETRPARALSNVLRNAVKYSPRDKMVVCTLSDVEEAMGCWAVIRVSDRGISIPAAEIERAFDPCYRASNALGRAEGTGLGMDGVRQIVEAHQGTIALENAEGIGTTVTLRLPRRLPEHEPGTAEATLSRA
jgi:signal transduction histidine kinase